VAGVPVWPSGRADNTESAESAATGPFESAARFVSVDATKNRSRFYELRLQATLWGGVALVRAWGRLGTLGRTAVSSYPDPSTARAEAERLVRRRRQRGYRLVRAR
jgi:predicted DNA-binding WGR domain protein